MHLWQTKETIYTQYNVTESREHNDIENLVRLIKVYILLENNQIVWWHISASHIST